MPYRSTHEWGPCLWSLIHTITVIDFEEPASQRRAVEQAIHVLKGLPSVIPCHKCHMDCINQVQSLEVDDWLEPMSLFYLMVDYHNMVNKKLGKGQMSYEDALAKWTKKT